MCTALEVESKIGIRVGRVQPVGTRAVDTRVAVVVAGVEERSQVRTNFTDIPDD